MSDVLDSPVATGFEWHYDDSPQHSPQWLACKRGRIGASSLHKWLAVSKAKASLGKPLKARLDYEKELMFERQFNTNFGHYTSDAMNEGNEFEEWAAEQYSKITGETLYDVGCWYNQFMAVSPDKGILDKNAGIEIKVLRDNSFTEVLSQSKLMADNNEEELKKTTTIYKHWQQIQAQLWATKWAYVDYVPINFNSKKVAIVRVYPDKDFQEYLAEAIQENLVVDEFNMNEVHDMVGEIPVGLIMPGDDAGESGGPSW